MNNEELKRTLEIISAEYDKYGELRQLIEKVELTLKELKTFMDKNINYTFKTDPYEVSYVTAEGCILWHPDLKEQRDKALAKARQLYPDQYYHRGLHTTKPGEFNGITIYLRDREPTEEELKLEELEGFPFRVKFLGNPFNTFLSDEVTA